MALSIVSQEDGPKASSEALAEARTKFNELLAKQQAEPDLTQPFPNKEKAPKAPGKAAKAAKQAKAPEPEPEADEPEAAPEKPAPKPELTGTRQRLALAGLPRKAIDTLSDQEVEEAWKKQEEREQSLALALQRTSELEKRAAPEAASKSEPLAGVPTDDLDLEEITADLAEQFGEDEAKVLSKALSNALAPLREENKAIRTILENARKTGIKQIEESNRARLGEKLPALKEGDRAWKILNAAAQEELNKNPSKFSKAEAVYDEVFESIYGGMTVAAPAPEVDEAEEKAKIAASSHTPPGSTKRQRTHKPEDAHRAAFEHLVKNPDDTDGARRVYGRYLVQ